MITAAYDPYTGMESSFATPCDIPANWTVGVAPDADGDGVNDILDAFPNDPAASVDTDGDGYPDAWNAAATSAQIMASLLTLDAFPNDSARWTLNIMGHVIASGIVTGAAIGVTDRYGAAMNIGIVATDLYGNFTIPPIAIGAGYPLIVKATGGIDQTRRALALLSVAPVVPLRGVLLDSYQRAVNISPFATLILQTATELGGINAASIQIAQTNVAAALGIGFGGLPANVLFLDPYAFTPAQVALLLKANAGTAAIMKRSSNVSALPMQTVISALAVDMTDGVIDGIGVAGRVVNALVFAAVQPVFDAIIVDLYTNSTISLDAYTAGGRGGIIATPTLLAGNNGLTSPALVMSAAVIQVAQSYRAIPLTVWATPVGGIYATAKTIQLLSSKPAAIYYTLDGTPPNAVTSVTYDSLHGIPVQTTLTLKFMAVGSGLVSAASIESYIISIDLLAPVVTAPISITVAASNTNGLPVTDAAIVQFLTGATAWDNVDAYSLSISNNAPSTLPVGITRVTFTAVDVAGNIGTASADVVVTAPFVVQNGASTVRVADAYASPGGNINLPLTIEPYAGLSLSAFSVAVQYDGTRLNAGAITPALVASWGCNTANSPPAPSGITTIQITCLTAIVADGLTVATTLQLPFTVVTTVLIPTTLPITLAANSAIYDANNVALPVNLMPGSITVDSKVVTYNLISGWNLIAFPVELGATGLADFITAAPDVNEVWGYAANTWSSSIRSIPPFLNSLKTLRPAAGYWIKVAIGKNPTVRMNGVPVGITASLQAASWNLIGTPVVVTNLAAYAASNGATEVWDYSNGVWCFYSSALPVFLNCLTSMQPEAGYYVKMP